MNAKKLIALLLAVVMCFGLVACADSGKDPATTTAPDTATGTPSTSESTEPSETNEPVELRGFGVDYAANTVSAGSVTTAMGEAGGGEVGYDIYAGTEGKDYTDPEVYTFRDYFTATSNLNWSTHNWETNEDSYILNYTTSGFYTFLLNSTADGWSISCEMASELPVDVTDQYVGQYGIEEGDTNKAFKVALNPNACWDNGEPINADTYIYSYKELLDPLMLNRRADSLYAGDFAIVGAKEYLYSGKVVPTENSANAAYTMDQLTLGEDGQYYSPNGEAMYIGVAYPLTVWLDGNTLNDYVSSYGDSKFVTDNWETLIGMADANGLIPLTDENLALFAPVVTGNEAWGETEDDLYNYFVYDYTYGTFGWDNVGIIKTGEYELVFITVNPTENPNYYVPYNLSSTYLVYEPMWEACKSYFDADGNSVSADADNVASITTNYGTSLDTSISYGPYKLTYFELDKQFTLERNDNWYGYADGNHKGQYQTDVISVQVIANQPTQLLAFLNGELDNVGLQSQDMADYGSSDYIRYTPQSYTTKLTFNTDAAALASHETGSQVLANANFRKAFTLAIDRTAFATQYTSAGTAGYGLLNYMYVYDPFTGAAYRDTDGAKDALVQLYGLTYGDDGEYGDLDEAYDAITGYDLTLAQELMAQAYEECVAAGYYDGTSNITIELSVYQAEDLYVQMFNFLNDALKAACVGTPFEGKVELTMQADDDYYNTMYSGATDIIFSTWGGAAYSPYTVLYQCYCDAADGSGQQQEYGFDTSKVMVTIQVDGHDVTTSLQTWSLWANGDTSITITSDDGEITLAPFGQYDAETRSNLFAKMEYAYLSFYATTPMYYRNSASLVSQKGDYAVQTYVDLIAFGGLEFYTYDYTDAEWDAYVATGALSY